MARQSSTTAKTKEKKSANKVKKRKGNENAPPAPVTPTSSARKDIEKTRKGKNTGLQSLRDAEKEIEMLKKQLKLAESGSKKKDPVNEKTPRPKGSFGSKRGGGQSIQAAMGLDKDEKNRQLYKAILYSAHDCAVRAGIDFDLTYTQQDDEKVAKFCRAEKMREEYEILRNYHNNWAARAVLQQYITNRRKNESRKEREASKQEEKRVGKAKASDDIDIDDEEEEESQSAGEARADGVVEDTTDDDTTDDDNSNVAAPADDDSDDD
ncbi:hypothetical protein FA95DRAFT_1597420 [Auriscalpium vulgare]|uniref:Uncharacterized protein n=1 Tax=Auriscalpium vulgare TaxID=40419 RepID=A0ACB8RL98_9AGAM|nr:hypothetical protein FA95DRAFT_1597420 [Auriscalpium vulgare]